MGLLQKIFGSKNQRELKKMQPIVARIADLEKTLEKKSVPRWLELDANQLSGRVATPPSREDIENNINEQLIVEFYSR